MEIDVLIDEGLEEYIDLSWFESVARQVLAIENVDPKAELSLVIVDQEKISQLNSTYLGKDEPTDVLSFPMFYGQSGKENTTFVSPPDETQHLGEVIISYPQAVIQANEHQHPVKEELAILVIHGVLHLLDYEHDKPDAERDMRTRESEILSNILGRSE